MKTFDIIGFIITSFVLCFTTYQIGYRSALKECDTPLASEEYTLELINQDIIGVYSHSSDSTFYVHPDSLIKSLELDNL
jgi:hypothetical protein